MLAWIHQSVASEKEFCDALLPSPPTNSTNPAKPPMLDEIFEGVAKNLRTRVVQIYRSRIETIALFRLSNLLEFYAGTLSSIIGPTAKLTVTLREFFFFRLYAFRCFVFAHDRSVDSPMKLDNISSTSYARRRNDCLKIHQFCPIYL